MANSTYEYVRHFEQWDAIPPSNWIVVRIDGRGFSKLCRRYSFTKPNDLRALALMNAAATAVVQSFVDVVLAYGQSDEYSFILHESTTLFERRAAKLATSIATQFTAEYCMRWGEFFTEPDMCLQSPWPTFDGRCVAYPKRSILRDYLSWRQVDCHINNLYNTTFWHMVLKGGMTATEAEKELKGSFAKDKNEILFKRFGVNYNDEPQIFRKGSVVFRRYDTNGDVGSEEGNGGLENQGTVQKLKDGEEGRRNEGETAPVPDLRSNGKGEKAANPKSKTQLEKERKRRQKAVIDVVHVDIIGDEFWRERPYILAPRKGDDYDE